MVFLFPLNFLPSLLGLKSTLETPEKDLRGLPVSSPFEHLFPDLGPGGNGGPGALHPQLKLYCLPFLFQHFSPKLLQSGFSPLHFKETTLFKVTSDLRIANPTLRSQCTTTSDLWAAICTNAQSLLFRHFLHLDSRTYLSCASASSLTIFFPVSFIFWVSKCFSLVYIHLLPRWSLTRPLTTTDNTPIYISSQDLCSRRQARISNRLLGISTWISTRPLKLPCLKLNSLSPPQSTLPECSPAQEIQPAFF